MGKKYYFFYLEIALKDPSYPYVYSFENVSHIPTAKLIEIFKINLKKDPYILEGYFLRKSYYKKHKKYIDANVCAINLNVFEYCLRQYSASDYNDIRKLYKESLME